MSKSNKDIMDKEVKRLIREVIGEDAIQKIASGLVDRDPSTIRGKQHLFAVGRLSGREGTRSCVDGDRGI